MTEHAVLVALRLGIVAAGSLATMWSVRLALHSKRHRPPYILLALGFGLLTLATVVEGALFEFAGWDLASAHTAEAFVSATGFASVLASIVLGRV